MTSSSEATGSRTHAGDSGQAYPDGFSMNAQDILAIERETQRLLAEIVGIA